jgi:hypothetical protein
MEGVCVLDPKGSSVERNWNLIGALRQRRDARGSAPTPRESIRG